MGKSAVLKVVIAGDSTGARKAMSDTEKASKHMGEMMDRAGRASAVAMGATAAAAVKTVSAASNLEQSMGAVESVFGSAAGTIQKFGDTAAESVGLSKREFGELASVSGAMLQNLGFSADQAAQKTIDLAQRAADLAAVFGGPASQAMDAMNAALRGEYDSLEQYGIKLSAAAVEEEALAETHKKSATQLTANEKAQAALNLIMDQSAKSAGQFRSESGTLAVQQQQLKASFENTAAQLGTALLPLFEQFVGWLQTAVEWVSQNQATVQLLATAFVTLTTAVLAITAAYKTHQAATRAWEMATKTAAAVQKLFGSETKAATGATLAQRGATMLTTNATKLWTTAQKLLNIALKANPIGLVITAVAALVTVLIKAYKSSETFRNICNALFGVLKNSLTFGFRVVKTAIDAMVGALKWAWEWMSKLIAKARELLSALNPFNYIHLPWQDDSRSARALRVTPRTNRAAGTGSAGVTINVSGALDPDAVARQIRSLLDKHDARQGLPPARRLAW